ncbi:MAG TPA: proline dehydrogenase family protein [Candidatus Dormibacteraeota bacterium]|nr:proline dehydrogenase family protein [Candidatus Dormibacteraeota bacterium]
MRGLLLWCATNPWLAAHVPQWGFVKRAVRRFMPGEEFEDALKVAVEFKRQHIGVLFTQLGENVTDLAEAGAVVQHFEMVLTKAAEAKVDPIISVKPTHVGLDIDAAAALENLQRLAAAAEKAGGWLWIDMEGTAYTDATLDLYAAVRKRHEHVGLAIQAYLYRTAGDVGRLLELKPAIRLVKGAYAEPPDKAFPAKRDVDANYLALCAFMLPEVKRERLRLVLGTHDAPLIRRITSYADALGIEHAKVEVNMLYGIQTEALARLAAEGHTARQLIAYGPAWYGWYIRRLAERPANVLFVARQAFGQA